MRSPLDGLNKGGYNAYAMPWDPARYEQFAKERYAPFDDLARLIDIRPGMRVIDLGCGTGELTARLADMLPESGVLDTVRGAVIASRDDETDLMALGVLSAALGRGHVWVLPSGPPVPVDPDDPGASRAARWRAVERRARRPFGADITHAALMAAMEAGGRVRTVDADSVPPGALPLVRLHPGG